MRQITDPIYDRIQNNKILRNKLNQRGKKLYYEIYEHQWKKPITHTQKYPTYGLGEKHC